MGEIASANVVMFSGTVSLTKQEVAQSKFFPNINTPQKAAVVLGVAKSHDLDVYTVAINLHWINGKPTMSGHLMATLVKRSRRYDYRVIEKTAKSCTLAFFEKQGTTKEELGRETFTMDMAIRADLTKNVNWKKFPEAMLFNRCLSAGVRAHAPDVLSGFPMYTTEEISPNSPVDVDGNLIIDAEIENSANPELKKQFLELLESTATPKEKICEHYGVPNMEGLSDEQLQDAIQKLMIKLGAMG